MSSLWEVLKTSKGLPAPDGFTELFARSLSDTYTLAEISGIPPLNLGEIVEIVDYNIEGNKFQSDGVSPDTPQEVKAVGDKTANLINANAIVKGRLDEGVLGYENETTELIVSGNIIKCTTAKAWRGFVTDFIPVEQMQYYLHHTATLPEGATYSYRTSVYDSQKNFVRVATGQSAKIITINDGEEFIRISYTFSVAGTFEISNIMLNSGSTPLPYEPYGYKLDVATRGKNIFDAENVITKNGYILGDNGEELSSTASGYTLSKTAVSSNTSYILNGKTGADTMAWRIYFYKDDTFLSRTGQLVYPTNIPYSFTTPDECNFIAFQYNIEGVDFSTYQLELGTEATSYEPYHEPITTPIYLDSPLYKIGDYADSRGMTEEVRAIKELVLTGDESYVYGDLYSRFHFIISDLLGQGLRLTQVLCTHYQAIYDGRNISDIPNNAIYTGTGTDVYIKTSDYTTVDDFKAYLAAQYANGTPVKVYYVLAEPEVTSVEPVEIPTLNGTTVIDVDTEVKPSNLKITYKSKV